MKKNSFKKIIKKKMNVFQKDNYNSNCVSEWTRNTITTKEKLISVCLFMAFSPLVYLTIKNLLKFYEKERKKYYHFIPRINLLLFTSIYSRLAVFLDGFSVIFGNGPLFKDIAVYHFLTLWATTSILLSCTYISTIW